MSLPGVALIFLGGVSRWCRRGGAPAAIIAGMLRIGDELLHPVTGERIRVVAHSHEELVLEDVWPPGHVVPPHRHPSMSECWLVVRGRVEITVDGAERTLADGQEASADRNRMHHARNVGDGPAHVRMTLKPPGRWLEFVERLFKGEDPRTLLRDFPGEIAID